MTDTIASLTARNAALEAALRGLLDHVDRNTCTHEFTHRGGSIWTICDECGHKWADDRGGFTPYRDPELVSAARAALRPSPDDRAKLDIAEECARIAAEEADEQDGAEGYLAAKTVEDRIRARFGRTA